MAAKTPDSDLDLDLDFAYKLQIQEAINASVYHSEASTSHSKPPHENDDDDVVFDYRSLLIEDHDDVVFNYNNLLVKDHNADVVFDYTSLLIEDLDDVAFDYTSLLLEDLDRLDQEQEDRERCEAEMENMRLDLDRRIHDQKLASEIMNIPDDEWENDGNNFERPYNNDNNESDDESESESESCRLYFKGMVSEEYVRDKKVVVAGIGVAICDPKDNLIFDMKKGLEDGYMISSERAELEALVEGLYVALNLNLERLCFFVDDYMVYQYVSS